MNVREINLNLLVAFEALLAERNVTRAAARMGLTQPAMSNVLAQLRLLFDDPLLVRGSRGMEPTVRALALAGPVKRGLEELDGALREQTPFDPASARRRFVLGANDSVEMVLLAPLLQRLAREAPGIDLVVLPWGQLSVPPALARGELDLALGLFERYPPGHRHAPLYDDHFVVLHRRDHPRVKGRLTLERYVELSHILVTTEEAGEGPVDRALAKLGMRRRVALRLPHYLMVPHIVAQTDLVVALSRRIAEPFSKLLSLSMVPVPLKLQSGVFSQVWHERAHRDPGQMWLRRTIAEVGEAL
jgi:DNA-binding transcriptional LysR family regulator